MNPNWDLSYLYKGFDDPAFLADLKRFPEEIKVEQAILDSGDDPQTKLEKLTDQQEVLGALSDRLSSFCSLTQAVDANNMRRFLFCTDDRHAADLVANGHLDNALRVAISEVLQTSKT